MSEIVNMAEHLEDTFNRTGRLGREDIRWLLNTAKTPDAPPVELCYRCEAPIKETAIYFHPRCLSNYAKSQSEAARRPSRRAKRGA